MSRIPQRDVNLANVLISTAMHLLQSARNLTDPARDRNEKVLDIVYSSDRAFDAQMSIREYLRKVNPVETKGQRG